MTSQQKDLWTCPKCHDTKSASQDLCKACREAPPPKPKSFQWLTTAPNPEMRRGSPFWSEYDQGQRGWRLHAVMADETEILPHIQGRRAVCGLRPRHGWDLDMFIEDRCARCVARLGLPELTIERTRRETRAALREHQNTMGAAL